MLVQLALVVLSLQGPQDCAPTLTLEPGSAFGADLARSGDVLVVGDPDYPVPGSVTQLGAAFVYERSAPGAPWVLAATLFEPASGPPTGHEFGRSVAVDGDRIAIGAPERLEVLSEEGAVYVYARAGASWQLDQALAGTAPDTPGFPKTTYSFGYDVALAGERLYVASATQDGFLFGEEALYYFRREPTGWLQIDRADIGSSAFGPAFGPGIAGSRDYLAVQTRASEFDLLNGIRVYAVRETGLFAMGEPAGAGAGGMGWNLALDGETLAACYDTAIGAPPFALVWDLTDLSQPPGRADTTAPGVPTGRATIDLDATSLVLRNRRTDVDWVDRFDLSALSTPALRGGFCLENPGLFGIDSPIALDGPRVLGAAHASAPGRVQELVPGAPGLLMDGQVVQREFPLSKSLGVELVFELQFDADLAGQPAWLLGSASGTLPGVPTAAGLIPLVPDGYTLALLADPLTGPIENSLGALDAAGRREVPVSLPPGVLGAPAGLEIVHAAIALDPATFEVVGITDTVRATVAP